VYVYVLEGDVRSQLGNAKPVEYTAGGSWTEHPGSVHTLTQNLSKTDHAKLLAIFIGKDDAKLTTSGTIGR
jgi:quercetin dioxygenase-like cupin family protein